MLEGIVSYENQIPCGNYENCNGDHRILIGGHRTEVGKFFIFTPASSHRALRVSQSAPASVILQCRYVPFRLVVLSPQGVPPTAWKTRRR